MGPEERTAVVNGLALHWVEWGPTDGPPLVLLHGITGHARTWDDLAAEVAPAARVIALDQRGHGDSAPAADGDYTVEALARDLAAFVEHRGLARFRLLGLSLGGRVAMAYASAHPGRVEGLVIVDIGPDVAPEGLRRIRSMMAGAPERLDSLEEAVAYLQAANPRYEPAALRARVHHGVRPLPGGGFTWKYDTALRDMMRAGGRRDTVDLWAALPRVACPTLIVRGAESDVLSPDIAARMIEALPDGRLIEVEQAGHTVPGDQPAAFARVVRSFLGV